MENKLLILTAPPASGKTYLINHFLLQLDQKALFISPLRALANECLENFPKGHEVMTPEQWLGQKKFYPVVILDEFHLYYYWGDTFRPSMWEAFFEMVEKAELVLLLTATLTTEMIESLKTFSCHFDQITWINHGNQILKNLPRYYLKARTKKWMEELVLTLPWTRAGGTSLIFCELRREVTKWENLLLGHGYSVWTCVGGEASLFSIKAQSSQCPPDFIVATTVLSHGVNLPQISRIFFLYPVKNLDFWIQMVARGGRKGESFDVYALEKPYGMKWSPVLNFLAILGLSLRMKLHNIHRQIEAWFLKA